MKDSAYYAKKAKDLEASEKALIATTYRNVEGHWSDGDEAPEVPEGTLRCLMARVFYEDGTELDRYHGDENGSVDYDSGRDDVCGLGYRSVDYDSGRDDVCGLGYMSVDCGSGPGNGLGLELDADVWSADKGSEDLEPHYCYMATNGPSGRSIIEQVRSMISENNFDATLCEPYLANIDSDLSAALSAYQSVLKEREGFYAELIATRERLEEKKLKIDTLDRQIVILQSDLMLTNEKCQLSLLERKKLMDDNVRLNTIIERQRITKDKIELHDKMTQNYNYPWSKGAGLGSFRASPLGVLQKYASEEDKYPPKTYPKPTVFSLPTVVEGPETDSSDEEPESNSSDEEPKVNLPDNLDVEPTVVKSPEPQSFTPIRVTCPTIIPQTETYNLSTLPRIPETIISIPKTQGTCVFIPDFSAMSNCIVEDIDSGESTCDADRSNDSVSFWATIEDADHRVVSSSSSDSPKTFKTGLTPLAKPVFENTYPGQTSKSQRRLKKRSNDKKNRAPRNNKPWLNTKDLVSPKTESKLALKKEIKDRLECSNLKSVNQKQSVAHPSVRKSNSFVPTKILKRPETVRIEDKGKRPLVPCANTFAGKHVDSTKSTPAKKVPKSPVLLKRPGTQSVASTSDAKSSVTQTVASISDAKKPNLKDLARNKLKDLPQSMHPGQMPRIHRKSSPYSFVPPEDHYDVLPKIRVTSDKTVQSKVNQSPRKKKSSETPQKQEWRIKSPAIPVIETSVAEIEYDFWINERTLTFCVFPKSTPSTPGSSSSKGPKSSL